MLRKTGLFAVILAIVLMILSGCSNSPASGENTPSISGTPAVSGTKAPTGTSSATASPAETSSPTDTTSPEETSSPTDTASQTAANTPTKAATPTATTKPSDTPIGTPTPVPVNFKADVQVVVDNSVRGKAIKNAADNINMWDFHSDWLDKAELPVNKDHFINNLPFVKYVQFMTATGGSQDRDLFKDPNDRSVKDDYDFSALIRACGNAVKQKLKPVIITGNVPLKLSSHSLIGGFGVNVMPPDDYNEYYNYIKAMADALEKEFGKAEVLTWRFGVFTEYENNDWFSVGKDPDATLIAYCKIYDYTVQALIDSVGPSVFVGAHSMTCSEGLWDESEFIKHCGEGTNYKTGKKGTRVCFLTASYYDPIPSFFNKISLANTIRYLRDAAESYGLKDLIFGVDEGRILNGLDKKPIQPRAVGQTYQASHDANLFKIMLDNDIDYFSAWDYTTEGIWNGIPAVNAQTANLYYKMTGSKRLDLSVEGTPADELNAIDGFAGYNESTGKTYVMAYMTSQYFYNETSEKISVKVNKLASQSGKYKVTRWVVCDDSNFFDEWEKDAEARGMTDDDFGWSRDSFVIPYSPTLIHADDVAYFRSREDYYREKAKLVPTSETVTAKSGSITLNMVLPHHAVVLYEITPVK